MAMESFCGTMDRFFRANGDWVPKMDLEFGNLPREIHMKDNG